MRFLFNALWRLSPIGINLQGPIFYYGSGIWLSEFGSVCHGCYRIYGSGWSAGGGFAVSEYGDVFPELFGFTAEYTDRDRQMDSTAYDGQRCSDVDIKDSWQDIAVAAVLPRRQHCRIRG